MDYKKSIDRIRKEIIDMPYIKVEVTDCIGEYMTTFNFNSSNLPTITIRLKGIDIINNNHNLKNIDFSIAGVAVDNYFININHIESVEISGQSIIITINIENDTPPL